MAQRTRQVTTSGRGGPITSTISYTVKRGTNDSKRPGYSRSSFGSAAPNMSKTPMTAAGPPYMGSIGRDRGRGSRSAGERAKFIVFPTAFESLKINVVK